MSVKNNSESNKTAKRVAVWFAVVGFVLAITCFIIAVITNNVTLPLTIGVVLGTITFFSGCLTHDNINRWGTVLPY